MKPQHVMINLRSTRRMLAWSALIAIALVLALLLESLAASALVAPGPVALSAACQAALAAGDNQRESFLEHSCVERLTTSPSAQSAGLGPLVTRSAALQSAVATWIRRLSRKAARSTADGRPDE